MKYVISIHKKIFSELNVRLFEKNIMFLAIGGFIIQFMLILFETQLGVEIFSAKQIYHLIPFLLCIHHSLLF